MPVEINRQYTIQYTIYDRQDSERLNLPCKRYAAAYACGER